MKNRTFSEGLVFALSAAIGIGLLHSAIAAGMALQDELRLWIGLPGLLYLLYLPASDDTAAGRLIMPAAGVLLVLAAWLLPLQPTMLLIAFTGLIWLTRTLLIHHGTAAVLADLAVSMAAAGAAIWALLQSGSLPLAAWSYFLLQALFSLIPRVTPSSPRQLRGEGTNQDAFLSAYRVALHAMEQLATRHTYRGEK
jgi:hypothetical protein